MAERQRRRRNARVPVRLEVEYSSLDAFLSDYAINMSRGGLFLASQRPAPVGTPVMLRFVLPDQTIPVEITGEVKWVNPEGVGQLIPGMGIEFRDLDRDAERKLARYVKTHSADPGDED